MFCHFRCVQTNIMSWYYWSVGAVSPSLAAITSFLVQKNLYVSVIPGISYPSKCCLFFSDHNAALRYDLRLRCTPTAKTGCREVSISMWDVDGWTITRYFMTCDPESCEGAKQPLLPCGQKCSMNGGPHLDTERDNGFLKDSVDIECMQKSKRQKMWKKNVKDMQINSHIK